MKGNPQRPLTTFNFKVNLRLPESEGELCAAEFSECSGLEMSMDEKTIREGGNNLQPVHLVGKVSYGKLSLKRGMTGSYDLWRWFEQTHKRRALRASGEVIMLSSDRRETLRFELTGCLPTKISAPSLNALSGQHAIEEMQLVYETLNLKPVEDTDSGEGDGDGASSSTG